MTPESLTRAKAEAIKVLAAWADYVRSRRNWSSADWGKAAAIAPTTITRGMSADAVSTTKIENLHLLARAARVPSVLDFLEAQSRGEAGLSDPWLPLPGTLAGLLAIAMHVDLEDREKQAELLAISHALHTGLELIAANPSKEDNPDYLLAVHQQIRKAVGSANTSRSKAA